jgi:hypothetical protein
MLYLGKQNELMKQLLAIVCLFVTILPASVMAAAVIVDPDTPFPKVPVQQTAPSFDEPNVGLEVHKINRMALAVTNNGFFGVGYFRYYPIDPETGRRAMSCEYPINSNAEYLWVGGLWVGAVVGRDTLVSTGASLYYYVVEFWPEAGEAGRMIRRSSLPYSIYYSADAVSEEDVIARYTDTLTDPGLVYMDPTDNRPHKPLNIEVTQKSYAWSYAYAEDFILFDFEIKNIGHFPLKQVYIGIGVESIVFHSSKSEMGGRATWLDDICGYREVIPSSTWPGYEDTIRVAWVADNDGDPFGNTFDYTSANAVTATRIIRTPSDSLEYSFNWWITRFRTTTDWGPRQVTDKKPYRDFGPNFGSPVGDHNKYYMLSTREFDYDQLACAVPHTGDSWLPPAGEAVDYADGHNPIYLLSFGPFDLAPDSTLPVTMAYVAGENFHHDATAFRYMFDPYDPYPYMDQLDFTDLGLNAIWAEWIYDNPGFDTDGDGDSGLARWFHNATGTDSTWVYYKGDGVPDFRGAAPPPPPELKVASDYGKLILRWNGEATENFVDVFSGYKDFEGYKVYYGEDNRISDFVLLAAYDRRDYNIHKWDNLRHRWEVSPAPLDYDSLVKIYGPDFEPDLYTLKNPLEPDDRRNPDGIYTYFSPQYWNESNLSDPYGIHKIYPEADLSDPGDTTDEGGHRFYEYEYIVRDLSPARSVYAAVTAFDYGSRTHQLSSLETSPLTNATLAYPLTSSDEVEKEGLGVYVYPNPYRIDAGYAQAGYENRDRTRSAERSRAVHFANLPRICTIRVYTLSGDLVREIKHYYPEGGPESMHEKWNLISRNTQAITTGIYIWSVSSEMGEQLGKLVIIK